MKFQVTFKDPNGADWDIRQAIKEAGEQSEEVEGLIQMFIRGGEYLTVEFDTETSTCIVVPR